MDTVLLLSFGAETEFWGLAQERQAQRGSLIPVLIHYDELLRLNHIRGGSGRSSGSCPERERVRPHGCCDENQKNLREPVNDHEPYHRVLLPSVKISETRREEHPR